MAVRYGLIVKKKNKRENLLRERIWNSYSKKEE